MTMNPQSARTLVWTAAICLLLGFLIPAPAGSLFLFGLAALCAAAPSIFARQGTRIAAVAMLVVAIGLAAVTFPKYQQEIGAMQERAKSGKR